MGLRHRCETVVNRGREIWVSEVRYLMSSGVDKDKLARQIAADKRITEGSHLPVECGRAFVLRRRLRATRPARSSSW